MLIFKRKKILIAKRADAKHRVLWEFPKGQGNAGESLNKERERTGRAR